MKVWFLKSLMFVIKWLILFHWLKGPIIIWKVSVWIHSKGMLLKKLSSQNYLSSEEWFPSHLKEAWISKKTFMLDVQNRSSQLFRSQMSFQECWTCSMCSAARISVSSFCPIHRFDMRWCYAQGVCQVKLCFSLSERQLRLKRMTFFRRLLRRRLHPWKLAIVALVFVTFLFLMQREVVSQNPPDEPWLKGIVEKRDGVLEMVMGAVNNFREAMPKMQIKAPVRKQESQGSPACLSGYYTAAELRPVLERPPQNPSAPGASGKAFHTDKLSSSEQKEKEKGEEKHCFNLYASDRISLSRDLGPDTRPPEYVLPVCFWHFYRHLKE